MSTPANKTRVTPIPISIEAAADAAICRDDSCNVLGIHAKHAVPIYTGKKRGTKPKVCPKCKEYLLRTTIDGRRVRRCEFCSYRYFLNYS